MDRAQSLGEPPLIEQGGQFAGVGGGGVLDALLSD
jgi:hypothetical protein